MKSKNAFALLALFTSGMVSAKLPSLTDEQIAKAQETKAKAAEVAKKDAESLAKAQDFVANRYIQAQKAKGVAVTPTPIPGAPAAAVPAKKN